MADPIPASVPPSPEEAPKATVPPAPVVPPVLVARKGTSRVWGIVDLILLLAVAAGAAFYAMQQTLFRHTDQIVDHPAGPLTHVRDVSPDDASAAPTVTTAPAK